MDADKTYEAKARWGRYKNATSDIKQNLEVTLNETAVQPLTWMVLEMGGKTNKTCGTVLEKQRRSQKRRFSMDLYTATYLPSQKPSK